MINKLIEQRREYNAKLDTFNRHLAEASTHSFTRELTTHAIVDCLKQIETNEERAIIQPILTDILSKAVDKNKDYSDTIGLVRRVLLDDEFRDMLMKMECNK